uniref:Uncharacterized protein n=1 Tax=Lepeophtheirus salmonis TaxID=72036 RepID=A0A0K2TWC6_LEPSM
MYSVVSTVVLLGLPDQVGVTIDYSTLIEQKILLLKKKLLRQVIRILIYIITTK